MKNSYLFIVIALVVGAGVGFYSGMSYGKTHAATVAANNRGAFRANGNGFRGGTRGAGLPTAAGFVNGQILSTDDKSMTVKLSDGGSKIVFYTSSTQMRKLGDATLEDLSIGKEVTVNGDSNSDGSVTARSIQLRPAMPIQTP